MTFTFLTAIKDGFADFALTWPTVLGQTHSAFEWIIVDDASASPVREAFPELARDPRVRILRNEQGCGQTASLNRGIREAKGDWIVRMDGDDLCAPDRLARIAEAAAANSGAALVFSDYKIIDGEGREWAEVRMRRPLPSSFFSYLDHQNNPICHPTVAFRRLKADGSGRLFREDLVNAQDYALWKELLHESGPASFAHLPRAVISYRIVRDSLSGARAREQEVEKRAIRSGQVLGQGAQARPLLGERQKDAMQSYRLLYYRFAGEAAPATVGEDLALLKATLAMPALVPRALFYLALRPLRKLLLRRMFAGIYE